MMKLMVLMSLWCFCCWVYYFFLVVGFFGVVVYGYGYGYVLDWFLVGGWGDGEFEVGVGCLEVVFVLWRVLLCFDVVFLRWNGYLEFCFF